MILLYEIEERDAVLMHKFQIKGRELRTTDREVDILIRGSFVALDVRIPDTGRVFIVANWQTKATFKIIPAVSIGQFVSELSLTLALFRRSTFFTETALP